MGCGGGESSHSWTPMARTARSDLVAEEPKPCIIYSFIWQCQNLVPLVNLKIAGKWMFITLKMVLIGIDP